MMNEDLGQDTIPVKEVDTKRNDAKSGAQQRRMVFKIPRNELEDRFLQLSEEHAVLKQHACKQEEKIKKMATKLIRLINDHKKQDHSGGGRKRDLETEDLIDDLQLKIRDLDKHNIILKEKLIAAKQQLALHTKRVTTTFSSQIPHSKMGSLKASGYSERAYSPPVHDTCFNSENPDFATEDLISDLKEQIGMLDQENVGLKQLMNEKQEQYEEQLLSLKSQMNQQQKQTIYENVEIIKLQRASKQAQDKITSLLEQYNKLQDNYEKVCQSHEHLTKEKEQLTNQLREQQQHKFQFDISSMHSPAIIEIREQMNQLQKEVTILKETNLKLINSTIHLEKEHYHQEKENTSKLTIMKLEESLVAEMETKKKLVHELDLKLQLADKFQEETKSLQISLTRLNDECENLRKQLSTFVKIRDQFPDLSDAALINEVSQIRTYKETLIRLQQEQNEHKFNVELENNYKQRINQLDSKVNELIAESNDLRSALDEERKRSRNNENEAMTSRGEIQNLRTELSKRENTLEIHLAHVHRLEEQLKDIAHGTNVATTRNDDVLLETETDDAIPTSSFDVSKNTFEIHVQQVTFTADGLEMLQDKRPKTFLTWCFYDFELVSTPVVVGDSPNYNCSAKYELVVDELFLHYMNKEPMTIELHEVMASEYTTLGSAQVRLRELLSLPTGVLHVSVPFIGITNGVIGNLEYSVCLQNSLMDAVQFYKISSKATGYLKANSSLTQHAINLLNQLQDQRRDDERANFLSINIVHGQNIHSKFEDYQPSAYCMYKFFDFPDHDTNVITSSNNPLFSDHRVFSVRMDRSLDDYLRNQELLIYVFDDDNDSDSVGFLGEVSIDLKSLADNETVNGDFSLCQLDGTENGILHIVIKWQFPYNIDR